MLAKNQVSTAAHLFVYLTSAHIFHPIQRGTMPKLSRKVLIEEVRLKLGL